MKTALLISILSLCPVAWALGQSNSLFLQQQARSAREMSVTTRPSANGALRANAGTTAKPAAWRNRALSNVSLTALPVAEPRIIKINDLIGVIVRHRLRYKSDSKLEQDSEWDLKAKLDAWFRFHDRKLQQQAFRGGKPEVKFKTQNELDNQGKADRRDVLETRLKAKVIDIKPNGNLVFAAWSRVKVDDEDQYIRLTGECSKDDIGADGNVTSDRVFGLNVQILNEGAVRDAVKRGWFKEFVDGVKPF